MSNLPSLPNTSARVVTAAGLAATEWYDFFRLLRAFVGDNADAQEQIAALEARIAALEEAGGSAPEFRGPASVRVTVSDSLVQFYLDGDEVAPGARQVYGTDDDGRKGWTPVLVDRLDGASYSTLQHFINTMASPGIITGCELSKLDTDTVQISAGTGMVRVADDDVSSLAFFDIPAATFDIPPDQETRFYGVVYSGGAVAYEARLVDDWDKDTEIPLGSAVRFNGTMVVTPNKYRTGDPITNVIQRFYANLPASRDNSVGGLGLGETGTRNVTLSGGRIWSRLSDFDVAAKDSGVDPMLSVYFNGTNLTFTSGISQWDHLRYNDMGTGTLVTLGNNKYANLWFFVSIDGSQYGFAYGTAEYNTLGEAADEGVPPYLTQDFFNQSLLVGRFLFQKSAATAARIESAFLVPFSSTAINDHNSLGGLQGGAAGEFYHLTAAERATVQDLDGSVAALISAQDYLEKYHDTVAGLLRLYGINPYADYAADSSGDYMRDSDGNLITTDNDGFPIPQAYGGTGVAGGGSKANVLRGDGTYAMELVTDTNPAFQLIKYSNDAAGPQTRWVKYRGTEAAPAAVTTNDVLMPFQARGGLSTAGVISESGNVGAYEIKAAEPFTNTGQGTYGVLSSTPTGSTARADQYLWDDVAFKPATSLAATLGTVALRWLTGFFGHLNTSATVTHSGVITPAALAANTDNYNPAGNADAYELRLSASAPVNLTGLQAGISGQEKALSNVGANTITLVHDATSTAANRFAAAGNLNVALRTNGLVRIRYDGTTQRWRILGP